MSGWRWEEPGWRVRGTLCSIGASPCRHLGGVNGGWAEVGGGRGKV